MAQELMEAPQKEVAFDYDDAPSNVVEGQIPEITWVACVACGQSFDIASTPDFNMEKMLCPTDDQPSVGVPENATADLASIIRDLATAEDKFIALAKTANEIAGDYKAKQNQFAIDNADLIAQKKEAETKADKAEKEVGELLVKWAKLTGEKTYEAYLMVKEMTEYDIDDAGATEWARENYKAAINEIVNLKMIQDYVKNNKGASLPFVVVRKELKPSISRKF